MWTLKLVESIVLLFVEGDEKGEVKKLSAGKKFGILEVQVGGETFKLAIEDFNNEESVPQMSPIKESRRKFQKRWNRYLSSTTSDNGDGDSSDTVSRDSDPEADATMDDIEADVSVERMGDLDNTEEQSMGMDIPRTTIGVHDTILRESFLGTFDVHVTNLKEPEQNRMTRLLDDRHVGDLTHSFRSQDCGQLVILAGMVMSVTVDADTLCEPDSISVQILGGNHTRRALQTLFRAGTLKEKTVKVNVYKKMDYCSSMAIGFMHNTVLHEKGRPMTMIEKARLMRQVKTNLYRQKTTLSKQESAKWKDMLCIVFRSKDRRTLQRTFHHLLLVALLPEEVWLTFLKATEGQSAHPLTDKQIKALMRIEGNQQIKDCLNVLMEQGMKTFSQKVKDLIEQGYTRGGTKKKAEAVVDQLDNDEEEEVTDRVEIEEVTDRVEIEEVTDRVEIEDEQDYKEKYLELKESYDELKREYDRVVTEMKHIKRTHTGESSDSEPRRRCTGSKKARTEMTFKEGDNVLAKWVYACGKEEWLDAKLLRINKKDVRVQYRIDGGIATVSVDWIKDSIINI